MGVNFFSKLVETVVAVCLTQTRSKISHRITKKYPELATADMAVATLHIAYEHGPSSRTTVALWATGSHEERRSQAKLEGVALSVQGRIVEPPR